MQRTDKQNRALHKWFREVAQAMRLAGIEDVRSIEVPIYPTEESIKAIYRGIAAQLYPGVESTADLSTTQLQEVESVLEDALLQHYGFTVPFPSLDQILYSVDNLRALEGK